MESDSSTLSQVETVFHEFGNTLQNLLTKQDEGLVSGSQGIEKDAIELAYQFMENWCCQRNHFMILWVLEKEQMESELMWLCSDAYSDTMLGYANSIRTIDGGTHIDGMKASLTRTLNNLEKKSKIFQVC